MNNFDEKFDKELEIRFSETIDKILAAEDANLSNADLVTPEAKHKLSGILKHYAKMEHPFTACVRDNRKRFGPKTEAICGVLKDLIRGTTKWRGHNNPRDTGAAGLTGLSSYTPINDGLLLDEETALLVDRLSEQDLWDLLGLASLSSETP